jgi:hypothetical protein
VAAVAGAGATQPRPAGPWVELPAAGSHFVTVNPVTGRGRNPAWRRYGTDRLVRVLLGVAAAYAAAHPDAPRPAAGVARNHLTAVEVRRRSLTVGAVATDGKVSDRAVVRR